MTGSEGRSLSMEFDICAPRLPVQTLGWGKGHVSGNERGKRRETDNKDWRHHMVRSTGHIDHKLASKWSPCWRKRCPCGKKEWRKLEGFRRDDIG